MIDPNEILSRIQSLVFRAEDMPTPAQPKLDLTNRGFRLQVDERHCIEIYDYRGTIFCTCIFPSHTDGAMIHPSDQKAARDFYTQVVDQLLAA